MTPEGFRAWRRSLGLTQAQAAARLDKTRNTVGNYELGNTPVPLCVELACAAISAGVEYSSEEDEG